MVLALTAANVVAPGGAFPYNTGNPDIFVGDGALKECFKSVPDVWKAPGVMSLSVLSVALAGSLQYDVSVGDMRFGAMPTLAYLDHLLSACDAFAPHNFASEATFDAASAQVSAWLVQAALPRIAIFDLQACEAAVGFQAAGEAMTPIVQHLRVGSFGGSDGRMKNYLLCAHFSGVPAMVNEYNRASCSEAVPLTQALILGGLPGGF